MVDIKISQEIDEKKLKRSIIFLILILSTSLTVAMLLLGLVGNHLSTSSHLRLIATYEDRMLPVVASQKMGQDINRIYDSLILINRYLDKAQTVSDLANTVAGTGLSVEADQTINQELSQEESNVARILGEINSYLSQITFDTSIVAERDAMERFNNYWALLRQKINDYIKEKKIDADRLNNIKINCDAMNDFLVKMNTIFTEAARSDLEVSKKTSAQSRMIILGLLVAGLVIAFIATIRSILQVKKLLDLFEKSKADQKRLASVMLRANDGILTLDENGAITSWNKAAEGIFKYDKQEALGASIEKVLPENIRSSWQNILQNAQSANQIHTQKFINKHNETIDLLLSVTHLPPLVAKATGEFSIIVKDVTEQILLQEKLEEERQKNEKRMHKELEDAKILQQMLFPETYVRFSNVEIAGHCFSASECGGDWWHYSQKGDKVLIWVGDATGHGLPAALITSAARSAVTLIEKLADFTPKKALELLNASIVQTTKGKMQMTFFLGSFDKNTKTLTYANAGHIPPLKANLGNFKFVPNDLVPLNDVNSPRLGEATTTKFSEHTIQLSAEDVLLFYTDGVSEVSGQKTEMSFLKNYCDLIAESKGVMNILNGLKREYEDLHNNRVIIDDITFMIAKIG